MIFFTSMISLLYNLGNFLSKISKLKIFFIYIACIIRLLLFTLVFLTKKKSVHLALFFIAICLISQKDSEKGRATKIPSIVE
jgi:lipoprotein signal peptidase